MEEPISQEQPVTPELLIPDRGSPFAALRHRNYQLYFGGSLFRTPGLGCRLLPRLAYLSDHSF